MINKKQSIRQKLKIPSLISIRLSWSATSLAKDYQMNVGSEALTETVFDSDPITQKK